jgi:hypothetical protein
MLLPELSFLSALTIRTIGLCCKGLKWLHKAIALATNMLCCSVTVVLAPIYGDINDIRNVFPSTVAQYRQHTYRIHTQGSFKLQGYSKRSIHFQKFILQKLMTLNPWPVYEWKENLSKFWSESPPGARCARNNPVCQGELCAVWEELDYQFKICRVTRGAHTSSACKVWK